MTQPLEYSYPQKRNWPSIVLCTTTWSLFFVEFPAAILLGNLHNGLRTIGVIEPRDVLATAVICGIPVLGILFALPLIWQARRWPWMFFITLVAVFFHAWSLYAWGRMELFFWNL
ncbi:MAG TPA: hypothetical protein VGN88_04175 [Phycisphaerae bacterium]|jgi:hypothetical protein